MPKGQKKDDQNEPDAGDQPQAKGPQEGSGTGSGTPASESQDEGKKWTRGDDPEDAAEQLRMANRGSTGGELNQPIPNRTPQQGDESPQDPEGYQSGKDVESQK